jgi:hypothetical protein
MGDGYAPIDITHTPELLRLVDEVETTGQPRVLRRAGEDVAVLMPVRRRATAGRAQRAEAGLPVSHSVRRSLDIVERTAGIFRQYAKHPPLTPEQEREAFEQGVAEQVAESTGG